ncbi:hypothetical protein [Microbacterium luteum]|uniref:hypothetical protein n=1 Tax=Microbacterium luteum TaxID=2782167 RepID=UPI001886FA48|nr:hypothetical protein [Microbacterium luteum]
MSTADEYTPTTGDVREGYVDAKAIYDRTASGAEFDRWLSSLLEGERARARTETSDAQRYADDLLAYVDYCLGLPMYQNAISDYGEGVVETLRMVKRTLTNGLHPDARAAAQHATNHTIRSTEG